MRYQILIRNNCYNTNIAHLSARDRREKVLIMSSNEKETPKSMNKKGSSSSSPSEDAVWADKAVANMSPVTRYDPKRYEPPPYQHSK